MSTFEGVVRRREANVVGLVPGVTDRRNRSLRWRQLMIAPLGALALAALAVALTWSQGQGSRTGPHSTTTGLANLPMAAQTPVSSTLGADIPAYRAIQGPGGGFTAATPTQRLHETFEPSGVTITSGGTRLGLHLVAAGYGRSLRPLTAGRPAARANRVVYGHAGLTEWYENGPLGLEQGFTVSRRPAADAGGPLTLSVALSGDATPTLDRGAQALSFAHAGATALRYTGLAASDARGHALHSWLSLQQGRLLIHVDARGAFYPLRIDPLVQEGEKLTGSGESGKGQLGASVALSENGTTALIGAPEDNSGVGAAWVFTRSGSSWKQQGSKLTGTGEKGDAEFGFHVALSHNGNIALIGGPKDHEDAGAAWVFTRSGSTWSQQAELNATGETGAAELGFSVALNGEGTTALVGGLADNTATGAAWVFTRSGEKWSQQTKLTASGEAGQGIFGWSVALSSDGNTALVGAPNNSANESEEKVTRAGTAFVFTRSGEKWSQQKQLFGKIETDGYFGTGVALSSDGNTALIGESGGGSKEQPAWVFTRSGEKWAEQAKFKGAEESGSYGFGDAVALSASGNTAIVGGPSSGPGAAWTFTRSGSSWSELGGKITGSGESGNGGFGGTVALTAGGEGALIGGSADASEVGAAWAYASPPAVETATATTGRSLSATLSGSVTPDDAEVTSCTFEYGTTTAYGSSAPCASSPGAGESAVAVSAEVKGLSAATTYHFRVSATNLAGTTYSGDQRLTTPPATGSQFLQQGQELPGFCFLCGFGSSVALSENGSTALMSEPTNGTGGAVRVFTRAGGVWTEQAYLHATEEDGEGEFGFKVALSANGDTALIGGYYDNAEKGAAWIFTRSGSTWSQQGKKLTPSDESGAGLFGSNVALSADGNTALVGAVRNEGGVGAAWVFTRSGSTWTEAAELKGGGESGNGGFGLVALSGDGETALVGAADDNSEAGAAWVYARSGSKWSQQAKLKPSGESGNGYFGFTTALSYNGETALVGGPRDNNVGAVWAFTRSGQKWTQQGGKLTGGDEVGEGSFGGSLAISADGSMALVGGHNDNSDEGAAWVFTRTGSTWSQQGTKLTASGVREEAQFEVQFGWELALSADGTTALIGGPGEHYSDEYSGAVWAFERLPSVVTDAASDVTEKSATLNATVNPEGIEVEKCTFEYGESASYGSHVPCSPEPGSVEGAVAVSAPAPALSASKTYHFRVVATSARGISYGEDETFTTLAESETAKTEEPSKPATATKNELSATASGGIGEITVGPYGKQKEEIGGPALSDGTEKYFDVYRSAESTFKEVEIEDCELGGGRSLWWDNPAAGWEPIREPLATYVPGSPACITVTLTEKTRPSVAELTGTRYGTRYGETTGSLAYGKCVAQKHGYYEDLGCNTPDKKNKGTETKGKYAWEANPEVTELALEPFSCFAMKHGRYFEGCATPDLSKTGAQKGKYERSSSGFSAVSVNPKFEIAGLGKLTCLRSSSTEGKWRAEKEGGATITFTGCNLEEEHRAAQECASDGAGPGTIVSKPLELLIEGDSAAVDTEIFRPTILEFSCEGEPYSLGGGIQGETVGDVNTMSLKSEVKFAPTIDEQKLETTVAQKTYKTTMTATYVFESEQEMEINTTVSGPSESFYVPTKGWLGSHQLEATGLGTAVGTGYPAAVFTELNGKKKKEEEVGGVAVRHVYFLRKVSANVVELGYTQPQAESPDESEHVEPSAEINTTSKLQLYD